jgi:hypothetical protein
MAQCRRAYKSIMRTANLVLACVLIAVAAGCAREPKPTALESAQESLAALRSAVSREVRDPQRSARVTQLVVEIERLLGEAGADLKAHDARIRAHNADYDATQESFRVAFRDFSTKRSERQHRLLEIGQRARALLSAAEWKALGRVREQALENALQAGWES